MFSQKNMIEKGGITYVPAWNRQLFIKRICKVSPVNYFDLSERICFRMCKTREGIACPLFWAGGSMTVEAALILPAFLLFCLTLLSFIDVMKMSIEQQMRQQEVLRNSAVYSTLLGTVAQGREGDCIKLDYVYPMSLTVGGYGYKKVLVRQRSMVHLFNGYDDSCGDVVGNVQEYVYVTERGSVYHKRRSCSALHISVRQVAGKTVQNERNTEGKIYRKCTICSKGYRASEIKKLNVYVTDYGVNYHMSITCRELKRTVQVIPIEKAVGKRACKLCG